MAALMMIKSWWNRIYLELGSGGIEEKYLQLLLSPNRSQEESKKVNVGVLGERGYRISS